MREPKVTELEALKVRNSRLVGLLDRLFEVADAQSSPPANDGADDTLRTTLDQTFTLLEEAVCEAERQRDRADQLEAMLARALDNLETLENAHTALSAELASREAAIEEVLALSERGLKAAASQNEALARLGFWRRLFGGAPVASDR